MDDDLNASIAASLIDAYSLQQPDAADAADAAPHGGSSWWACA
jgi:hypothetical protein